MKKTVILLLLAPLWSLAQQAVPDTVQLPQVSVKATRTTVFSPGTRTVLNDTAEENPYYARNIAELLEQKAAVFIKSNGSGGVATITTRGTEARHNAVLWHGFNLNSATLGLSDLSLIPVYASDNAALLHGGSAAVNGNSAIGSVIILENLPATFEKSNRTSINLEAGSFGNLHGNIRSEWTTKFLQSTTTLFYDGADNDYKYINIASREHPEEVQQHAAYSGYGLIQDFAIKIKPGQVVTAGAWYQVTNREIPALMMVPESFAEQADSNLRIHAGYHLEWNRSLITLKGAIFNEQQHYKDERYGLNEQYDVKNYFGEAEWRYFAGEKIVASLGCAYNEATADFEEYQNTRTRAVTSLYGSIRYYFVRGWNAGLNVRQEFSNITNPPLAPYLTLDGNLFREKLFLSVQAGRHFSLPSMNDLYWVPGGNPDLEPEFGWTEEISIIYKNSKWLPEINITVFNSNISNWIKWQPGSNGYYEAENLEYVHARGAELFIRYTLAFKTFKCTFNGSYANTRSGLSETGDNEDPSVEDKQLIYVPENVLNLNLSLEYKNWFLQFTNAYVGNRFTTTDNSHSLESYHLANLTFEKKFPFVSWPFGIYVRISNLYDTSYQVMAWQPVPGRGYHAGIRANLSLLNKNKNK